MPSVIVIDDFLSNPSWPQPPDNQSERDPIAEYLRLVVQAYHYSVQNPW